MDKFEIDELFTLIKDGEDKNIVAHVQYLCDEYHNRGYNDGYEDGRNDGYDEGYEEARADFQTG